MDFFEKLVSVESIIEMQETMPYEEKAEYVKKGEIYTKDEKVVIPRKFVPIFALRLHFLSGHCGKRKLYDLVRMTYYADYGVKDICTTVCESCLFCLVADTNRNAKYPDGRFVLEEPNKAVQIDLVEDLPVKLSILTIVDIYSGYINAYILKSKTTESVIHALANHFSTIGKPRYLVSDNASIFRSKNFIKFLSLLRIGLPQSAPYRSEARSLAENANKFLQEFIKKFIFPNRDCWETILPFVIQRLNSRINTKHQTTPHKLLFGRDVDKSNKDELYKHLNKSHVYEKEWLKIENEIKEFEEREKAVIEELNKQKEIRQEKRNQIRRTFELNENDYVLVKHRAKVQGVSRKLLTSFGNIPFKVVKIKEYGAFIENTFDGTVVLRAKNELKLIKTIESETLNVPKEIVALLGQVTKENLLDWFHDLNRDEYVGVQTRSQRKNEVPGIEAQMMDLMESDEESEDEETDRPARKKVTFQL